MTSFRRLAYVVFTALALGTVAGPALADSAAQGFIQQRQQQVTSLLKQPSGAARDKQIAGVLDGMLDYELLAKRSLAKHWDDVGDEKRKEFTELLKRLVQRNYEKNIKNIAEYDIEWLGEDPGTEGVVIHTRATSKTNKREEPVTIDYRVHPEGSGYRVFDIVTEGSSLVNNYKNQFHRIIQKDGVDALLKRMRDKLAKGGGNV